MIKRIILFVLASTCFFQGYSQQETDLRQVFLTAESYFLFEEFEEALPLYLRIHRQYPKNDNINYKIGICFLNNPYEKNKAISYLEQASKNINQNFKENNFKETAAPPDAFFYLGNAYLVNNQVSKARDTYKKFLELMDNDVYDSQLVADQLKACDAADKLMKKPIDFDKELVSDKINTRFADLNPVISGDENSMVFVSKLQFYDAVFYSVKVNGEWTTPRNIVSELGVDGDVYPTSMSFNGDLIYIYRNDDFIGNIYSSTLVNNKWTSLVKLNDNINTKYWESHACQSKDGNSLYFSSNRKGGFGGLDIYKSEKTNGNWGPATNLGSLVNSVYNDDTPFVIADESKLFFSSYGHYNMGGYDIFMSAKKEDGSWAEPLNMGFPINTTDDDQFFNPVKNGEIAYYARFEDGGFGRTDIFKYHIYSPDNPRKFLISGLLEFMANTREDSDVNILLVDKKDNDTVIVVQPDSDGKFSFRAPAGDYQLIVNSDRFKKYMMDLEISEKTPLLGMSLPAAITMQLKPLTLTAQEEDMKFSLRDTLIEIDKEKEVTIRFNAERGSTIKIDIYNEDSILVKTETIEADRRRQSYNFTPEPGNNTVHLQLKDSEGNVIERSMRVIYNDPDHNLANEISDDSLQIDYPDELVKPVGLSSEEPIPRDTLSEITELARKDELILEIDAFRKELAAASSGKLEEFLNNYDVSEGDFSTVGDFFNFLKENASDFGYTEKELYESVIRLASTGDPEDLTLQLSEHSFGELQKLLQTLDTKKEGIESTSDLIKYLINNTAKFDYNQADVINMLTDYYSHEDVISFLQKLINNSDGDLQTYLKSIDPVKQGIDSKQLLIDKLLKDGENNKIDSQEIISAILRSEELTRKEVLPVLINLAHGKIASHLSDLPDNILTADDLFRYLIDNSENNNYSEKDVLDLFSNYLRNLDLYNFHSQLIRNSEGALFNTLSELNLSKAGIKDASGLIRYLLNNSESGGYTKDDVYDLLGKIIDAKNLESFVNRLKNLASGGLLNALNETDLQKLNIKTVDELIEYLLSVSDKYGYDQAELLDLISQMAIDKNAGLYSSENLSDLVSRSKFRRSIQLTGGLFLVTGLIVFIIILITRRRKKKEEAEDKFQN